MMPSLKEKIVGCDAQIDRMSYSVGVFVTQILAMRAAGTGETSDKTLALLKGVEERLNRLDSAWGRVRDILSKEWVHTVDETGPLKS